LFLFFRSKKFAKSTPKFTQKAHKFLQTFVKREFSYKNFVTKSRKRNYLLFNPLFVLILGEGRRNKRVFPGQLAAAQRFQPAGHGGVRQGWKKPGFFYIKNQPSGFF
jgi:hypothetical protein